MILAGGEFAPQPERTYIRRILKANPARTECFLRDGDGKFPDFAGSLAHHESVFASDGFRLEAYKLHQDFFAQLGASFPGCEMQRARFSGLACLPLEGGDARCLQALGSLGHFEFNRLRLVQRLISLRLNRGEMDENVLAGLTLDESKALAGIKPLYCSLFSQLCFSFLFELFGATSPPPPGTKKAASVDLQPFNISKGFTRATNATTVSPAFAALSIQFRVFRDLAATNEAATEVVQGTIHNKMARPERFELPTLCFEGRCSIQLSYGRVVTEISSLIAARNQFFRARRKLANERPACQT